MLTLAPLVVALAVLAGARRAAPPRRVRPLPGHATPGAAATMAVPTWFVRAAVDAALDPVDAWWRAAVVAPLVSGVGGALVAGPAAGLAALVAAALAEAAALRMLRGRATRLLARSVPEALEAIARSCRAGSSVVGALAELGPDDGPAAPVLAGVATRVAHGVALRDALDGLVVEHPVAELRLAAAALLVGADTGAAPARAVDGVAATLRDRAALEREAAGLATQSRASAAVLVVAPVGFGVVAIATDPRVASFLFTGPAGWACLGAGVGLDVLGGWWMSRLVRSAR